MNPARTCPRCGKHYESLLGLPRGGTISDSGEVLLLVHCECSDTMSITLVPLPEDVRARLGLDCDDARAA